MGNVSDLIWSVVLSNPEKEGLKKIHEIAAARVRPPGLSSSFRSGEGKGPGAFGPEGGFLSPLQACLFDRVP